MKSNPFKISHCMECDGQNLKNIGFDYFCKDCNWNSIDVFSKNLTWEQFYCESLVSAHREDLTKIFPKEPYPKNNSLSQTTVHAVGLD